MKLFDKTLLIIIVTVAALTLVTYLFSENIMIGGSQRSDESAAGASITVARSVVNESLDQLTALVKSYSVWDDTYQFMGVHDEAFGQKFVDDNLNVTSSFVMEETALRMLVDRQGAVRYGAIYDAGNQTIGAVPADVEVYLRPGSPLLFPDDADSTASSSGVMVIGGRAYLVSAAPVFPTNATGPARGTLIFGRLAGEDLQDQMQKITQQGVAVAGYGALSGDFQAAAGAMDPDTGTAIVAANDSWLGAYALIDDINGNPAFIVRTLTYRKMYLNALDINLDFIAVLVGTSLVICATIIVLLDRTVLRRLSDMGRRLVRIGKEGDLSSRLPVKGEDEIGDLATNINDMLASLHDSQQQLVRNESKYRSLFDNMPGGCMYIEIVRDAGGRPVDFVVRDLNGPGETILCLRKALVVGQRFGDAIGLGEGELPRYLGLDFARVAAGRGFDGDVFFGYADRWLNCRLFRADAENYILMFDDVTERKRREQTQLESERRMAQLADEIGYIIWRIDDEGSIESASRAGSLSLGYEAPDLVGRSLFDLLHPDDRLAAMISCENVVNGGKELERELRVRHKDGPCRCIRAVISPAWDVKGAIAGAVIEGQDVTEQKRTESALRESEERYRTILDAAQIGIVLIDAQTHQIVEANPQALEIFRASKDDVVGKVCHQHICPTELGKCPVTDLGQRVDASERYLLTKAGERVPVLKTVVPARIGGREVLIESFVDITQLKQAEEALRESEADLARAQSIAHLGSCRIDVQGNQAITSAEFYRILGMDVRDKTGAYEEFLSVIHPEDRAAVEQLDASLFRRGGSASLEFRILRPDGALRTLYGENNVTLDEAGRPTQFFRIIQDITDRKKSEEQLRESEEKFRSVIEQSTEGFVLVDQEGRIVEYNKAAEQIYGYAPEDCIGVMLWEQVYRLIPEGSRAGLCPEMLQRSIRKYLATGENMSSGKYREIVVQCKDGSLRYVQTIDFPIHTSKGFMIGNIVTDITERKRAEEALLKSEADLARAQGIAHLGSWELDLKTGTFSASDEAYRIFGADPQNRVITLDYLTGFVQPQSLRYFSESFQEAMAQRKGQSIDFSIVRKDGVPRILHGEGNFACDEAGEPVKAFGTIQDITDRKRMEEALRESEEMFRVLAETTTGAIFILQDERFVYANPAALKLSGYSLDEVTAMKFWEIVDPEHRELVVDRSIARIQGADVPGTYEIKFIHRSKEARWAEINVGVVEFNKRPALMITAFEITARKFAEGNLLASLKEKEVLLKEIHHRVKNNLQIISSLLSLQSHFMPDNEYARVFSESRDRIRSMALIHEMLYQSKNFARIDFTRYASSLTDSLLRSYNLPPGKVQCRVLGARADLTIEEAVPCGLIVNELVSNSLKYAFPGDRAGAIDVVIDAGDSAFSFTISDDGAGLPPGFDLAKSNTLGLQLVNMLVDQLEGTFEIGPGPGARFTVRFGRQPGGRTGQ